MKPLDEMTQDELADAAWAAAQPEIDRYMLNWERGLVRHFLSTDLDADARTALTERAVQLGMNPDDPEALAPGEQHTGGEELTAEFDDSAHPRGGNPANTGEFSTAPGGGEGAKPTPAEEQPAWKKTWAAPPWHERDLVNINDFREWLKERDLNPDVATALTEGLWQAVPEDQRDGLTPEVRVDRAGPDTREMRLTLDGDRVDDEDGPPQYENWGDVENAGLENEACDHWMEDTRSDFEDDVVRSWRDGGEPNHIAMERLLNNNHEFEQAVAEGLQDVGVTIDPHVHYGADASQLTVDQDTRTYHSNNGYGVYSADDDPPTVVDPRVFATLKFEDEAPESWHGPWPPYEPTNPMQLELGTWEPSTARSKATVRAQDKYMTWANERVAEHLSEEAERHADDVEMPSDELRERITEDQELMWDQMSDEEHWAHVSSYYEGQRRERTDYAAAATLDITITASEKDAGKPSAAVHVDYFGLRDDLQGKGTATRMVGQLGQLASSLGIKGLAFEATTSPGAMNGAYTWAKLGFPPADPHSWEYQDKRFRNWLAEAHPGAAAEVEKRYPKMMQPVDMANFTDSTGKTLGKEFMSTHHMQWSVQLAT